MSLKNIYQVIDEVNKIPKSNIDYFICTRETWSQLIDRMRREGINELIVLDTINNIPVFIEKTKNECIARQVDLLRMGYRSIVVGN